MTCDGKPDVDQGHDAAPNTEQQISLATAAANSKFGVHQTTEREMGKGKGTRKQKEARSMDRKVVRKGRLRKESGKAGVNSCSRSFFSLSSQKNIILVYTLLCLTYQINQCRPMSWVNESAVFA